MSTKKELSARVRRQSIGCDIERKDLGELADKLAILGGQVAIVARMGDEDTLEDIIDDSEHIFNKSHTFALRSESHQLNGDEAFSFDDAFDDHVDTQTAGESFCFAYCDSTGKVHITPETVRYLSCKYDTLRVIALMCDEKAQHAEQELQSTSLLHRVLSTSSAAERDPSSPQNKFSPSIPGNAVDYALCGTWGPSCRHASDETSSTDSLQFDHTLFLHSMRCTNSSPNALANVFKMNMVASIVSSLVVRLVDAENAEASFQVLAKYASTAAQFVNQLPPSAPSANRPLTVFMVDESTTKPTFLSKPEDTSLTETAKSMSLFLSNASLVQRLAADIESYFECTVECNVYCVDTSIDTNEEPSWECAMGVKSTSTANLYTSLIRLLQHVGKEGSGGLDTEKAGEDSMFLQRNFPLLRSYLSAINPTDDGCDSLEGLSSHTMVSIDLSTSAASLSDESRIKVAAVKCMEKYRSILAQHLLDPSSTPPALSLLGDEYIDTSPGSVDEGTATNSSIRYKTPPEELLREDYDEVDVELSQQLTALKAQAKNAIITKLKSQFPNFSTTDALALLSPAIAEEEKRYSQHSLERSRIYCEKVLRDAQEAVCKHVATSIDSDTAVKPDGVKAATPTPSGSRIDRAEELSKILQLYFAMARGGAKREVITAFLAENSVGAPDERGDVTSLKEEIQQYQLTNNKLKTRIENLVAENTLLHQSVEDRTDKALDAWAALQEKYISLEKVLTAVNNEKIQQEEYISKLKSHITKVEKVNEAMKKGVAKILDEEDTGDVSATASSSSTPAAPKPSGIAEMWTLALACATGAPMDDYYDPPRTSSGVGWISHPDVNSTKKDTTVEGSTE